MSMLQNLSIGVIITGLVMAAALVGMIVCAKKQNTHAIAKPLAVVFMGIVLICAIVILMKTGVLGDAGTKKLIENEMTYARSSAYMLGKTVAEKCPGAKALLIVDRQTEANKRQLDLISALKEGAAGKITILATETPNITLPEGMQAPQQVPGMPGMDQMMMPISEMVRAQNFDELLAKYPDCNLIISFIGLPQDVESMTLWQLEPDKRPKIAILNGNYYNLKNAVLTGTIVAIVGYHPKAKFDESKPPTDMKTAFEKRYILITPENVEQLSAENAHMFEEVKQ